MSVIFDLVCTKLNKRFQIIKETKLYSLFFHNIELYSYA